MGALRRRRLPRQHACSVQVGADLTDLHPAATRHSVYAHDGHNFEGRRPASPRIVVDRKGRGVRVEVRRAREAGQLEMPI